MRIHSLEPTAATLHGYFSRERAAVLTIPPGDRVRFRTLDVSWGAFENPNPFARAPRFPGRDEARDPGHALVGPVAIEGARAGMTLEVRILKVRTGRWGFVTAGGSAREWDARLGLAQPPGVAIHWALDPDAGTARSEDGLVLPMRPFPGILGMPPAETGRHSTVPPRPCGGNIDCRELVEGSRLFLPIPVDGALFSTGDGHALQGDGEVAGPALECPMECIELEFHLHSGPQLSMPRADTPVGWITFGFAPNLEDATRDALAGMLVWMSERLGIDRKRALAYASLLVSLRLTQVVNGVRGVHAILAHDALARLEGAARREESGPP